MNRCYSITVLALFISLALQAQNSSPYWSLAGNSNASATSKLGTTNLVPLNLTSNNITRVKIFEDGRLGIGGRITSTNATRVMNLADDNAVMRIIRTHSSFAPAVELISRTSANGSNVAYWDFYAEPTDKSFRIRDRIGGGSGLDRVTVSSAGDVGVGTTTPAQKLHVLGNSAFIGNVAVGTTISGSYKMKVTHATFGLNIENATTLDDWEFWSNSSGLSLYANGNFRGNFSTTTGAYSSVSDQRLKTNIQPMPSVLDGVKQLKPTTYQFVEASTESTPHSYGFLAQDVLKVFPSLVTHTVIAERGVDAYTLDYGGFAVIAIKAIQELVSKTDEIEEIKQQNAELRKELADLKEVVSKLSDQKGIRVTTTSGTLLQNVPNPVRGTTLIKYALPEGASRAQLLLIDASGRTIKSIQLTSAGVVNVDVSALSSGVYNYSLVVNGQAVQTRKLTVER